MYTFSQYRDKGTTTSQYFLEHRGVGVWLATEYIPAAGDQNPLDNWGTYVFEVNQFSFRF